MRTSFLDKVILATFLAIVVLLPAGLVSYHLFLLEKQHPDDTKLITLTGSVDYGWIKGEVGAARLLAMEVASPEHQMKPVAIDVKRGDRVVLRLTSSDVVHGFSLKEYSLFVNDGIEPGKPVELSFIADKPGNFIFSCNAICGKNHEKMQGILRVHS